MEELYRYISFESFVGMVQKQALTFVSPELWDDPKEIEPFINFANLGNEPYRAILGQIAFLQTYCQSWTSLSESDAMWRIYSYNNCSIRIRISKQDIKLLKDIKILPVKYTDDLTIESYDGKASALKTLAIKRIAFNHEKEIRLVKTNKIDSNDIDKYVKCFLVVSNHKDAYEIACNLFPNDTDEDKLDKITQLLNWGKNRKYTSDISFAHIPNFIKGAMVNPFAPDWFVEVVEEYCKRNSIHFDGKSTLYKEEL